MYVCTCTCVCACLPTFQLSLAVQKWAFSHSVLVWVLICSLRHCPLGAHDVGTDRLQLGLESFHRFPHSYVWRLTLAVSQTSLRLATRTPVCGLYMAWALSQRGSCVPRPSIPKTISRQELCCLFNQALEVIWYPSYYFLLVQKLVPRAKNVNESGCVLKFSLHIF